MDSINEQEPRKGPHRFYKGMVSPKHRPVGAIKPQNGKPPLIKVAEPNKWGRLHVVNWKKYFGEIPKGYIVWFKDGNPDNCEPENLFLKNWSDHVKEHSFANLPPVKRAQVMAIRKEKFDKTRNERRIASEKAKAPPPAVIDGIQPISIKELRLKLKGKQP